LLSPPVPFAVPLDSYREHGFLFAKSGHGKTQTLRALTASLIEADCALFLIDGNAATQQRCCCPRDDDQKHLIHSSVSLTGHRVFVTH
jgi:hypothetical protein